jgi:hypothetical protein
MRTSIHVSSTTHEFSQSLREVHELVTFVLHLHKDDMQARSQPSTAPQFQQGDKVSVVGKGVSLCGHLNYKLKDGQSGPFTVLEKIGANMYILALPYIVCLHNVSHVSYLRPCPNTSLPLPLLSRLMMITTSATLPTSQLQKSALFVDVVEQICCSPPISRTSKFHMFGID